MFDRDGFREFFIREVGDNQGTLNTYNSYLGRIDKIVGGLDERIAEGGGDELLGWMLSADTEPFVGHRAQCRSITKTYIRFRTAVPVEVFAESDEPTPEENAASVFKFERELQAAVRLQLSRLEDGLSVYDDGFEASFDTGRSDILARDRHGCAVVVELKAGPCPKGALEQVLGYAQNWIEEGESRVRCIVVAGSFTQRQRAAAKRVPALELKTYRLEVMFSSAD